MLNRVAAAPRTLTQTHSTYDFREADHRRARVASTSGDVTSILNISSSNLHYARILASTLTFNRRMKFSTTSVSFSSSSSSAVRDRCRLAGVEQTAWTLLHRVFAAPSDDVAPSPDVEG